MTHHDLIIVGSGSGNSIPVPEMDDWSIGIVEAGRFGGTCLNVGCIPSKMFVYAADVVGHIRSAGRYGVDAELRGVDWPAIRDRVFGRIDPIVDGGEDYRRNLDNTTLYHAEAKFVGEGILEVDGEQLTADRIVLAAGSRPSIPPVPGIESVDYHTSDTVMHVDRVPERLIVLGAGYIAAELGHVFEAFGSEVTIVTRGEQMLTGEDCDVRARFTEVARRRFDIRLNARHRHAHQHGDTFVLEGDADGEPFRVEGDALLVATGRRPNSDRLAVERSGIHIHPDGRVVVDDTLATGVDGIWAFGDLTNPHQLKHVANAEARVVTHNLLHPDAPRHMDHSIVPHAVFTDPQVASVGLTEQEAEAQGLAFITATQRYDDVAYGWAMEDRDGFVKLIAHADTRRLLGAHIMGAQASTLIQQLIQGMKFESTIDEMGGDQFYIHPALTEVVENALLKFRGRAVG